MEFCEDSAGRATKIFMCIILTTGPLPRYWSAGRFIIGIGGCLGFLREGFGRSEFFVLVPGPESLAKEYVKHYGVKRYKILSNWVDVQRFKPREDKASTKRWFALEPNLKVVLFVHHLSERKGADLVPRIAEGFGKDFKFWVIGEGPYLEKIKNQKSKIKIFGKISNQAISVYFQAADVFILPSREEGSPHVILEALAAGTPFVASDVGGIREIVPPGFREFLCPVGDVSCFQEKINKLLEDENLYQKLSREGLEFARKFDKSRGVSEFLNLFYN